MRAGRQIRWEHQLKQAYEKPCSCGHVVGQHRELRPAEIALVDGEIVETPNPDYRPLHFHCTADGCDCVLDRSAS